jgi:hypothetical protein
VPDLTGYFASGRAADVILVILAIEWLWLARRAGPATALAAVLPGGLIVLGLRAALTDAHWTAIALPLALSFPAHLWDLARRPPGRRAD